LKHWPTNAIDLLHESKLRSLTYLHLTRDEALLLHYRPVGAMVTEGAAVIEVDVANPPVCRFQPSARNPFIEKILSGESPAQPSRNRSPTALIRSITKWRGSARCHCRRMLRHSRLSGEDIDGLDSIGCSSY
jgi:hypothetical protein